MKIKLLIFSLLVSVVSWGQVNLASGATYPQNFDGLGSASATWTDNTTLPGWYVSTATLPISTGTTASGTCVNVGILGTNPLSDRALGCLQSGGTAQRFGLRLKNNGASNIGSYSISFTGEQWRSFNAGTLVFEYQIGTTVTSLTVGTWTAATAFNFNSLVTSGGTAVDGNAPANRTAITGTLTAAVPAGSEIFFRWTRNTNSSPILAVDDFSVTANAATPLITLAPTTLSGFTYVVGSGPSGELSFNATGANLVNNATGDITITTPTDYEVSLTSGGAFGGSVTIPQVSGAVASTPVYVRLKAGLAINTYNGETITATSASAVNKTVTCNGSVTNPIPTITVSPTTLIGFTYILGAGPSAEQTFTASGVDLTSNITITPSTNYEISTTTGAGFGGSVTLTQVGGVVSATTIYVRLKAGLASGNYNSENITASATGAVNKTVVCSGTVVTPTITLTPTTLTGFSYLFGSGPSPEQTFTASGVNLTSNITIAPSTNYEISTTTGAGFGGSITLSPTAGTVSNTTIYVRLKAGLAVGAYNSEVITATATNAVNKTVTCSGSVVTPAPANDACATATALTVGAAATNGTLLGSGATAGLTYQPTKKDVWYSFMPTCTGNHIITVTGYSGDVDVDIFTTSCPISGAGTFTSHGSTATETVSNTFTSGVTYYIRVLAFDVTAETSTFTIQVTGNTTAPVQPGAITGNVSVCQGTSQTYSVTAVPGASTYTWTLPVGWTGTSTTNSITTMVSATSGNVQVTANNNCGSSTAQTVAVAVATVPTPVGNITVTQNCGNADLSFDAPNANWYWQTSATGTSTANPTTGTYNVTTNGTYYVRATDGTCWSAGTVSLAVTVNAPVVITTQPTAQSVNSGSAATYTVAATGTGLNYLWEVSTNGGGSWTTVGTNSNTFNTGATTTGMNGNLYHVIVSGAAPCASVTSNNVSLTVNVGTCVDEAFAAGISVPSGWTFTNIGGTYTSAGNFGAASPSLQMDNTGDVIETPAVTNAVELSFWLKGQGAGAVSALLVEGFNGVSWVTIQNITASIPTVGTTKIYNASTTPALPANLIKFRFTYTKVAGNVSFDDVKVICGPILPACTTPVTQATALTFPTVTATGFSGSYTAAAAPGANAYLVVYSTNPTLTAGD
jgi:hypothetical protein